MIKKLIIALFYGHVLMCSDENTDFLKRNGLVLSPEQKVVYDLFVNDWKTFAIKHGRDYDKYCEDHKEALAFCFLNRCYYQHRIDKHKKELENCQNRYNNRMEEMKHQYSNNVEIDHFQDWYYQREKIHESDLQDAIAELRKKMDKYMQWINICKEYL